MKGRRHNKEGGRERRDIEDRKDVCFSSFHSDNDNDEGNGDDDGEGKIPQRCGCFPYRMTDYLFTLDIEK